MGDYHAKTIKLLENVVLAVNAAGTAPEDIVSSTLYIKGLTTHSAKKIVQAMAVALDGKSFPAHAFNMIGVEALADPRSLIQMSAIAVAN